MKKSTEVVAELEKLKAEMSGFTWGPYDPFNVINKRIAKLKGEDDG